MSRKLYLLSCLLLSLTLAWPVAAQRRRARGPVAPVATNAAADARVRQLADEYLRGYYEFNPTKATALGLHEYDAQLEARSSDAIAREVRRVRATLAQATRTPEWRLSPEARYDFLVVRAHAQSELLELEDVRLWQRNPNLYNVLLAESVDNILKRNYAPIEQRLDALLARERQAARLLAEARANLQDPPRIYTETALAQARGGVNFFQRVVPQMFERAGGGRLSAARRSEFAATNR